MSYQEMWSHLKAFLLACTDTEAKYALEYMFELEAKNWINDNETRSSNL